MSLPNPFNTLQKFSANGAEHSFYSLPALEKAGFRLEARIPDGVFKNGAFQDELIYAVRRADVGLQ